MMYYMECGGVENALVNLLEIIDSEKYEVDLYFLEQRGAFLCRIPKYVNIITLPLTEIERRFAVCMSAREILQYGFENNKYIQAVRLVTEYAVRKVLGSQAPVYETVLHDIETKDYDIALDFHGYLSLTTVFLIKKIRAKKYYTWVHSEGFIKDTPRMDQYLEKYDRILCVSKKCRELMCEILPEYSGDKIGVCYNILCCEKIREKSEHGTQCEMTDVLKLVTVGRMSTPKGYDIAVEVANLLKQRGIRFHWWFCGDGEMRHQIEAQICQMNLQKEITLLGFCDNPYGYMASADIYVQPSRYEGYAVTVTEASALGCVIVSTDVSGATEEIEHGQNGLITSVDAEALADAITQIAENSQIMAEMRRNACSRKKRKANISTLEDFLKV